MGPIILFDKSFLQALSVDESVWFDNFFYPVISPLFYIETLADLWKKPREGMTAEQEVGVIAAKTPELHGGPCHFHQELCIHDLVGNRVPMTGQIPLATMRRVVRDGKVGAVAEITPEAKAFQRWQRGRFYEVERLHARAWREFLQGVDLGVIEKSMKQLGVSSKNCKTVDAALKLADEIIAGLTRTSGRFDAILEALAVPHDVRLHIKGRWKRKGKPSLAVFAPYANHVLRVELFFRVALGANLIASTRASHKVDMAYLFYLPFCALFTSYDKLHKLCAPLFLRRDQQFISGQELKADLAALNQHFSGLSDDIKRQGIYRFANRLPDESHGLIRQIFVRHAPNLLKPSENLNSSEIDPMAHKKLISEVDEWASAPATPAHGIGDTQLLDTMVIERSVRVQRGSWIQINPEIWREGPTAQDRPE